MKKRPSNFLALSVLFVTALTLVYWNHFDNAFQFDDMHTIVDNHYIRHIQNIPIFFKDGRAESSLPENQTYRPVVTSLNAIDYWLAGGLNPKAFHWHIYVEFLLLLALLYRVLLKVFELSSGEQHQYVAFFAMAFFAFHTATAETINYIIARSDGFSTLMVLAGMLIYISNTGWKKQWGLLPFMIGCLAKPTALMLAPLLAAYSLILECPSISVSAEKPAFRESVLRTAKHTASFFLVGAGMYLFTRSMYPETWKPGGNSVLEYLNTQPFVILIYLKTFILPTGLSADTDLKVIKEYLAPRVLMGLTAFVVLLLSAWFASRKRTTLPIAFGILWFFICLVPTSSVIPLAEVLNHHRTFFPYIGLTMAATWGSCLLFRRWGGETPSRWKKNVMVAFAVVILGLNAAGTYQRNEVWDSEASLWLDVTKKSPKNGRGLMNYGLTEMRKGNMQEAISYFKKAQETDYGNHPYLFINLGIATNALSDQTGDQQLKSTAENYFKTAVQLGPGYPLTHYRYGWWLHKNNRSAEAFPYVKKAIELSPALEPARQLLQQITNVMSKEIEFARENATVVNTPEAFINLSLQYYNLGQYENCIQAAKEALNLKSDSTFAYNNICAAYNRLEQPDLAIKACESALAIDPEYSLAKNNLNWARQLQKAAQ